MSALSDLYTLPQEHLDFRDTIRQIVTERVAPRAAEIDEKAEYPQDLRELFANHDLFGLPFDTEHGGTGTGQKPDNLPTVQPGRPDQQGRTPFTGVAGGKPVVPGPQPGGSGKRRQRLPVAPAGNTLPSSSNACRS